MGTHDIQHTEIHETIWIIPGGSTMPFSDLFENQDRVSDQNTVCTLQKNQTSNVGTSESNP
jgi:hypothetical protein